MENVAVAVAVSAYFLASATNADALGTVALIERAAHARLALERRQGGELIAKAADKTAVERIEQQVIAAWKAWYSHAFDSIGRLPPADSDGELTRTIADAKKRLTAQ